MGVAPTWDHGSARVSGFAITPLAVLGRPRVDVTLRVSGLFRDSFPMQMDLFAAATRALAALDEPAEDNPFAAARVAGEAPARLFGAAPGAYGVGLTRRLAEGTWETRDDLAQTYLAASAHAYSGAEDAQHAPDAFRARIASADAYMHVADLEGQDALNADAVAEHAGGFAAAAEALGAAPTLYRAELRADGATKLRTLGEDVTRALHARATNPRWLQGQMRHGYRGAQEIAASLANLFAFAALTDVVRDGHFDMMCAAVCEDEAVRAFLIAANPAAARDIARIFDEARARNLWTTRRNVALAALDELREAKP
jgi:cobaltochelatase CobN